MTKEKIVFLCGPTAVGKSALSLKLAEKFGMEIVSVDSQLVWKNFDIGTAKPSLEEQKKIPHHLIDVLEPTEYFDASKYTSIALQTISEILKRGGKVLCVGGSGMYVRLLRFGLCETPPKDEKIRKDLKNKEKEDGLLSLHQELEKIDPKGAAAIHPNDSVRIFRSLEVWYQTGEPFSLLQKRELKKERFNSLVIGLKKEREELRTIIDRRVDQMLENGWLAETKKIVACFGDKIKPMQALGYRELAACLKGEASLEEVTTLIKTKTKAYAKRQMTWFRAEPGIEWFCAEDEDAIAKRIEAFYDISPSPLEGEG